MNIIIPINNINDKNIYFHDPIKNTVINNGDFIRILYTDKFINPANNSRVDKYFGLKKALRFNDQIKRPN